MLERIIINTAKIKTKKFFSLLMLNYFRMYKTTLVAVLLILTLVNNIHGLGDLGGTLRAAVGNGKKRELIQKRMVMNSNIFVL